MKLEQAARALLAHWDTPAWKYLKPTGDLMADLREALAEQDNPCKGVEQEPVAWMHKQYGHIQVNHAEIPDEAKRKYSTNGQWTPLYAASVRTKYLTDDEIYKLADDVDWAAGAYLGFARAIEAKIKEKNK